MQERILIVDDSASICDFIADYILKPRQFETLIARDGMEGIAKAREYKPDLIIADLMMPQMTGLEMIAKLNESGHRIPAILMTAHGSEEVAMQAVKIGVRGYVIKPFEVQEMHDMIEIALRESRLKRERDRLTQELVESNASLRRSIQELNTLYEIGKTVTESLNLQEVLNRVAAASCTLTEAEEGYLMLLDRKSEELYIRASKNLDSEVRAMRLPVRDSLAGQVLRRCEPLIIDDNSKWQKIKTSYFVKSLVYMPLILKGRGIGVLAVANREKETIFNEQDTRVLTALADYAVIAIQNASRYAAAEDERQRLDTILAQISDPVLVLDNRGKLLVANSAACLALNLPTKLVVGTPIEDLLEPGEILDFVTQSSKRTTTQRTELMLADKRIYAAQMSMINDIGRSIVFHDVTRMKELDRMKSEFVSTVSHDLRSPLTAIKGYVELLPRAGTLNDTQQNFVARIQDGVHHITNMVNDLLDLGRLEAGIDLDTVPCNLREIFAEVVGDYRMEIEKNQQALIMDLPEEDLFVLGDPLRLRQAFSNLLGNATKYTPEGGRIGLRVRERSGQVLINVYDTGIGIPPENQPKIFDKFFRGENAVGAFTGTGLGLSIVKSTVDRHQGRIWVNSQPGKGTTFTVVLPHMDGILPIGLQNFAEEQV